MTDRIKLSQDEVLLMADVLKSKMDHQPVGVALQRAVTEVNSRRTERAAEIRAVVAEAKPDTWTFSERGAVSDIAKPFSSDELRARMDYVDSFQKKETSLRVEALHLAIAAVGDGMAYKHIIETAGAFEKYLNGGESA